MPSISDWLGAQNLSQYADVFAENDIDLEILPNLSEQDLERLGMSMGHRKKLLKAISEGASFAAAAPSAALEISKGSQSDGEGERRQLTVMFCDLVNSTAMSERLDPEEMREVIRGYQRSTTSVIELFDGHIAQYLGDGLLVYFGHPVAHEDDAQRAVRAALAVVSTMQSSSPRAYRYSHGAGGGG